MAESDKGLYFNSASILDEDQVEDNEDLPEDEALFTIPTLPMVLAKPTNSIRIIKTAPGAENVQKFNARENC